MSNANVKALLLTIAALLVARSAAAQTTTVPAPTTTLAPTTTITLPPCTPRTDPFVCNGAKKLYVTWVAKDPQRLRVSLSATRCPEIPRCGLGPVGALLSEPPVSLTITDANSQSFSMTVTDPGTNFDGCPSGKDDYRGAGRMRFVFGACEDGDCTTLIGKQRLMQTQTTPPSLTPPLRVLVSDGCGPLYTYTVNTCYPRVSDFQTYLKCF